MKEGICVCQKENRCRQFRGKVEERKRRGGRIIEVEEIKIKGERGGEKGGKRGGAKNESQGKEEKR